MPYQIKLLTDTARIESVREYLGERFSPIMALLRKSVDARSAEKMRVVHHVLWLFGVRGYLVHHAIFRHAFKP